MSAQLVVAYTPDAEATPREIAERRTMAAAEAIALADDRGGGEGVAVVADGRETLTLVSDEIPDGHVFQFATPSDYGEYMVALRMARAGRLAESTHHRALTRLEDRRPA
ncbi:hypothetical protein [Herbiconiux sp. VKM Ac-2851]|uniref:hypothetical protein n=1 Tax=Herbiconiux sp. VKM Ac-2851 TaxID=2739025 RepID=UPI001564CD61|nr:hypothetical protein [Herbiconiux sp. VKM Ac-2851]NQX36277.1 hypothetical protein [Herbiconiux sp. VKM Ac-2851]